MKEGRKTKEGKGSSGEKTGVKEEKETKGRKKGKEWRVGGEEGREVREREGPIWDDKDFLLYLAREEDTPQDLDFNEEVRTDYRNKLHNTYRAKVMKSACRIFWGCYVIISESWA